MTAGSLFTTNSGSVQMQGGTVTINGDLNNTAIFRLGSGGNMTVFGNVTNTSTGSVRPGNQSGDH